MKKYGTFWVPSKSEIIDRAKQLRSIHRKNKGMDFHCLFDPENGKFIFERSEESRNIDSNYIEIPCKLGTYEEKEWESVDYVRTQILAYVVDKGGST